MMLKWVKLVYENPFFIEIKIFISKREMLAIKSALRTDKAFSFIFLHLDRISFQNTTIVLATF